jgi:diguanylate cyclase (GGDEF)-like protein
MNQNHRGSVLFTALCTVIACAAGVGVWYVLSVMVASRSLYIIPLAAIVISMLLLFMLRESMEAGVQTGYASAESDVFTRLPSHAVAYQFLLREFAAAERGRLPLTVVLFSLDNLPRVAATKGGAEVNRLLLSVGAIFKRTTRGMNMTARLDDGYTFMAVLGGVDEAGAAKFADKITRDLSSLRVADRPLEIRVGLHGYEADMAGAEELMAKAHDALALVRHHRQGLSIA